MTLEEGAIVAPDSYLRGEGHQGIRHREDLSPEHTFQERVQKKVNVIRGLETRICEDLRNKQKQLVLEPKKICLITYEAPYTFICIQPLKGSVHVFAFIFLLRLSFSPKLYNPQKLRKSGSEFLLWLSGLRTRLVSMRIQAQSLALLSGLRIWYCPELRCRSKMQLRSCVTVAVV